MNRRLGLIVNPFAGIGGKVGLKGSDGQDIVNRAISLGAVPVAPYRAIDTLRRITPIKREVDLITCPGDMGEDECQACNFEAIILRSTHTGRTTAEDTKNFAVRMLSMGVDLILLAGGDGTAKDVYDVIDEKVPVLGIPAGVKIHSAIFAINPISAGELAVRFLQGKAGVRQAEVMDVDEDAFRQDRVSARLLGYLKVPYERTLVQDPKVGSSPDDEASARGIALDVLDNMEDDCMYIIGPGTTTKPILDELGLHKTLLGVDVVYEKQLVASDVNESRLLKLIDRKTKVIVTVIGGQGFILGRGSQQISPEVIRRVRRENILVVATPRKMASLGGRPLLVDTGNRDIDRMLSGYIRVITGYRRSTIYPVKAD
jgi:predicted polyphosphate/ATP-dependent NAD kinase